MSDFVLRVFLYLVLLFGGIAMVAALDAAKGWNLRGRFRSGPRISPHLWILILVGSGLFLTATLWTSIRSINFLKHSVQAQGGVTHFQKRTDSDGNSENFPIRTEAVRTLRDLSRFKVSQMLATSGDAVASYEHSHRYMKPETHLSSFGRNWSKIYDVTGFVSICVDLPWHDFLQGSSRGAILAQVSSLILSFRSGHWMSFSLVMMDLICEFAGLMLGIEVGSPFTVF